MKRLAALLLFCATAVHGGLVVSPEKPVSPLVLQPALGGFVPAAAFNSDLGLAVWLERDTFSDLRAARFTADGQVLDPGTIVLSDGFDVRLPHVIAAGDRFFAVWTEANANGTSATAYRFINRDGNLSNTQFLPNVAIGSVVVPAFDGTDVFITRLSQNPDGTQSLDVTVIGLDGNVVAQTFLGNVVMFSPAFQPVVAGGHVYLVYMTNNASLTQFSLQMNTIDAAGHIGPVSTLTTAAPVVDAFAAGTDGTSILAMWSAYTLPPGQSAQYTTQAVQIAPLTATATPVLLPDLSGWRIHGVIADSTGYIAELERYGSPTIALQRIGSSARMTILNPYVYGTLNVTNRGFAVTAMYDSPADIEIHTITLDSTLTTNGVFAVALAPEDQQMAYIARRDRSTALALWQETSPQQPENRILYSELLDQSGNALGAPTAVAVTSLADVGPPSAAWNGSAWLALWGGVNTIAQKLDANGKPLDNPLVLGPLGVVGFARKIVWDGDRFIVAFVNGSAIVGPIGVAFNSVHAITITRDLVIGPDVVITPSADSRTATCDVAAANGSTLIVWPSQNGIAGRFIRASGLSDVLTIAPSGSTPHVVWTGDRFLVAWLDQGAIQRATITLNGNVTPSRGPGVPTSISATSGSFSLAPYRGGAIAVGGVHDVDGVLFDADGNLAGSVFPIADTAADENNAIVAGGDLPLVIYMRPIDRVRSRAFVRLLFDIRGRTARH